MQNEAQYLGFIISEDGIMAKPDKVKVMRQMLPPICVREVRSFIGICNYYRRFLSNFSAIAKPLIRLTKKFAKFDGTKTVRLLLNFSKELNNTTRFSPTQILANHAFSIQMLLMTALLLMFLPKAGYTRGR